MAKASAAGRTKTRLVPPLTFEEAAEFNTAFLRDVADNIATAGLAGSIQGYVAYGPPQPDSVEFFRSVVPSSFGLFEAWQPNFGDSLFAAIDQILGLGHESAVVLNSDSPTLPTSLLVDAAEYLSRPGDRAVLGPSTDGGYYLLGIKTRHRRLFQDITWSTEHVARQTIERAAEIGLEMHMLPAWYDVDDVESLRMLYSELCDGWSFATGLRPHDAHHSNHLMRTLLSRSDLMRRLAADAGALAQRAAE
jgi:rSAM/selenodomain-associated transferase 1